MIFFYKKKLVSLSSFIFTLIIASFFSCFGLLSSSHVHATDSTITIQTQWLWFTLKRMYNKISKKKWWIMMSNWRPRLYFAIRLYHTVLCLAKALEAAPDPNTEMLWSKSKALSGKLTPECGEELGWWTWKHRSFILGKF